jgi:hypothetical protein
MSAARAPCIRRYKTGLGLSPSTAYTFRGPSQAEPEIELTVAAVVRLVTHPRVARSARRLDLRGSDRPGSIFNGD